jgi:hypothetical protein
MADKIHDRFPGKSDPMLFAGPSPAFGGMIQYFQVATFPVSQQFQDILIVKAFCNFFRVRPPHFRLVDTNNQFKPVISLPGNTL